MSKKIFFLTICMLISCIIVPVNAVVYQDTYIEMYYDSLTNQVNTGTAGAGSTYNYLLFPDTLIDYNNLWYVGTGIGKGESPDTVTSFLMYNGVDMPFLLYDGSTEVGSGTMQYYVSTSTGSVNHRDLDAAFWFNDLDIPTMYLSGNHSFRFENNEDLYYTANEGYGAVATISGIDKIVGIGNLAGNTVRTSPVSDHPIFARAFLGQWSFQYYTDADVNQMNLVTFTPSILTNWSVNVGGTLDYNYVTENVIDLYYGTFPLNISVVSPFDENYFYNVSIGDSVNNVNIFSHVWSTGDNSLIAGVSVNYTAVDDSDQVIQTLTNGEGIVVLQKNTPYYFTATAEGFRSQSNIPDTVEFLASTQHGSYLVPIVENASAGNGTVNFHVSTYTSSGSTIVLEGAIIEVNGQTLITNDAGFAHIDINKTTAINYAVSKTGYQPVSRIYTPSWPPGYEYIDEWVTLRADGQILPGEPTAEATPDTRTNVQKADSALNILFENIELFATMAVVILIMSFIKWIK